MKPFEHLRGRDAAVLACADAPDTDPIDGAGDGDARLDGTESSADGRCSPDPLRDTDRYRLVTPYVLSARALRADSALVRMS